MSEPGRVLINGEWQDCVSVRDRGFQYGDGVFETIAVRADAPLRFERHLDRLELGCARLGIPVPDRRALRDEASRTCVGIERAVLKLVLTRGPSDRGYAPPRAPSPTRVLALSDWPAYPPAYAEDGVAVRVCAQRLSLNPRLAGIKHLNRLEQVLARAEWGDEYAEGLMLNARDEVVDGTMSNLFAVLDGMLVTPDIIDAGVAGIMRGRVLERAAAAGVPCQVRPLALSELRRASELFLTNSLIGIWPVRRLDEHALRPGPVTRALQRALEEA